MRNIHLLVIDGQNDFCHPDGALYVAGAEKDMERLAAMIDRIGDKITDIHATLDSHRPIHIAHPVFFVDANGNHPAPFTIISSDDVKKGRWNGANPAFTRKIIEYLEALENSGRYPHCIWNPHCLIGTWGHALFPCFSDALVRWQNSQFAEVDFITKGSNMWTEHFSAVKAEVPDSADSSTLLNIPLIKTIQQADDILITGEALSHCVANTIRDIAAEFGDDEIKKFILLQDTCSNVGGFESFGENFVTEMVARGMRVTTSTEYLA